MTLYKCQMKYIYVRLAIDISIEWACASLKYEAWPNSPKFGADLHGSREHALVVLT